MGTVPPLGCPVFSPVHMACAVQGAGDKAFCAGGDVKTVVQQGLAGQVDEALRLVTRSEPA